MPYPLALILATAICVTACSPETTPKQQAHQGELKRPTVEVPANSPSSPQSADAKSVAKAYGVTEERANDVAGRAAALSGGNASKQDMLDALKAARGE